MVNNLRESIIVAIIGLLVTLATFTIASFGFFGQFATKAEIEVVRGEQARRTGIVYGVPNRLDRIEAQLDRIEKRIDSLMSHANPK